MQNTRLSPELTLERPDGAKIRYLDLGPPDGEPVLLLHPFLCTTNEQWGSGSTGIGKALLDKGFRIVAADLRGHGGSSKSYDPAFYGKNMVEDLIALLDQLGIEKCSVAAYSMGSEIAIYLAAHHLSRVNCLCVGGSGWSDKEMAKTYLNMGKPCGMVDGLPSPVCWARICWYPCCCPCLCYCCRPDGEISNLKALVAVALAHARELVDLPEQTIQAITVPVCGISGEKDKEKKYLERMQGVLANYEYTMIPKADHMQAGNHKMFKDTLIAFMVKVRDDSRQSQVQILNEHKALALQKPHDLKAENGNEGPATAEFPLPGQT